MDWKKPVSRAGFLAALAAGGYVASDYATAGPTRRVCSTVFSTVTQTVTTTVTEPPPPMPLGSSLPARIYDPLNPPTAVRTFYLDWDAGSDSNTVAQAQSEVTPWKTLSKFISSAATPGDHCLIKNRSGQNSTAPYTDANIVGYMPTSAPDHVIDAKSGNSTDPIVVKAYPGHRPVIRCPAGSIPGTNIGRVLRLRNGSKYWVFDGLDLAFGTGTGGNDQIVYMAASSATGCDHVEFWGCDIHGSTDGSGIIFEKSSSFNTTDCQLINCNLYENNDWRGAGFQSHGGYIQGDRITFLNVKMHDQVEGAGCQIKDGATDIIIANPVCYNNKVLSGLLIDTRCNNVQAWNGIAQANGTGTSHGAIWGWNNTDSPGLPLGSGNVCRKWVTYLNAGTEMQGDSGSPEGWDFDGAGDFVGPGDNQVDTNPLMVNPGSADFHLQAGSPAIGYGNEAYCPPFDFDNNPRSQVDAGVYRFGTSGSQVQVAPKILSVR